MFVKPSGEPLAENAFFFSPFSRRERVTIRVPVGLLIRELEVSAACYFRCRRNCLRNTRPTSHTCFSPSEVCRRLIHQRLLVPADFRISLLKTQMNNLKLLQPSAKSEALMSSRYCQRLFRKFPLPGYQTAISVVLLLFQRRRAIAGNTGRLRHEIGVHSMLLPTTMLLWTATPIAILRTWTRRSSRWFIPFWRKRVLSYRRRAVVPTLVLSHLW